MMKTTDQPLHQISEAALARHPGAVVDATIHLWRKLAPELIPIIGERGFETLYSRSIRLACVQYPWMKQGGEGPPDNNDFPQLRQCLQTQDDAQASQASMALFTIFFDTLASLIGEALTKHLLRSAWGQETSEIRRENFQ